MYACTYFSGRSFLAYNVGPSLERELSISIKIKTLYTAGTILHSFGHFDYALLEVSWDVKVEMLWVSIN